MRKFELTEPDISAYKWDNGRNVKNRAGAFRSEDGKVFIIDPIGTYNQIDMLFSIYISYVCNGTISDMLVSKLLDNENVILRLEMMFQQGMNSDIFKKRIYDLSILAIERLDVKLISKLYDDIQFEKYPDYPEWMLEALFFKFDEEPEKYDWAACKKTLELFVYKKLKCRNIDDISTKVILSNHPIILDLLNKLRR